jgi:predicted dehydrogenase
MSESDLSRRNFLRSSAAAAALAAGAQFALAAEPPASKPAATTASRPRRERKPLSATTKTKYSQVRLAFVGIGGRGRSDLQEMNEAGATIVAICDTNTEWLDNTASELDRPVTKYSDWRNLLEKEARNIDGVVVATPDHNHAIVAHHAMKLGKHVYCEKPLTYDIHEARTLTEAARKYKVKTQMGNQGSANDNMRRQVEYARSGIVGNILEAHVYTNRPIWPQGLVAPKDTPPVPPNIKWDQWLGPAPYRPYHPDYLPFKWRGWWDFGTGALGDMACHLTNTAFWALDLRNPAVATAFQNGMTKDSPPKWEIIKLEFPEYNGRPPVKLFWYDGGMMPPHTLMGDKKFPGEAFNGVVFVGEKGNIAAGYMQEPFLVNDQQQKDLKPPEQFLPRSIGHHKEFLEAIVGGPAAASNFDQAGPLTEMVLVGNLAVRSGQRVEWDAQKMKASNSEAQKYVKRDYRKGWEL